MSRGIVFKIQKFCLDDGPGIRTCVFMKGCALRCLWCHNPESFAKDRILGYYQEQCILCGQCVNSCPQGVHRLENGIHRINREACTACGTCVKACPAGALKLTGQEMESGDVLAEIEKDAEFYRQSGGGVTLTGGEPLLWPQFCAEIGSGVRKRGIPLAIETSGYVPWENISRMLPYVDLWLYDIKETDEKQFQRYTGGDLKLVLQNLSRLADTDADIILRCPVIPGVNDRKEHFSALKNLGRKYKNIRDIQIMPYHNTGEYKKDVYGCAEQKMTFPIPDEKEIQEWEHMVKGIEDEGK